MEMLNLFVGDLRNKKPTRARENLAEREKRVDNRYLTVVSYKRVLIFN